MAEIKKMGYCVNGEWKESKAEKYNTYAHIQNRGTA